MTTGYFFFGTGAVWPSGHQASCLVIASPLETVLVNEMLELTALAPRIIERFGCDRETSESISDTLRTIIIVLPPYPSVPTRSYPILTATFTVFTAFYTFSSSS